MVRIVLPKDLPLTTDSSCITNKSNFGDYVIEEDIMIFWGIISHCAVSGKPNVRTAISNNQGTNLPNNSNVTLANSAPSVDKKSLQKITPNLALR